ncbi:MAG: hypothetical protein ACSLFB_01680 [Acidimicrobiales bacterium]
MNRGGRSCLIGGLVVAVVLLGAAPAMAISRSIEWINPTIGDPVFYQAGKIAIMTNNDDGRSTDKIEISIGNPPAAPDPCSPSPTISSVRPPTGTRGAVPYEADIAFPCNGTYSLVAKAWNTRQGLDLPDVWSSTLALRVSIPPATVSGLSSPGWVAATGEGSKAHIELNWNPNAEVDLLGYRVDRSINDQSLVTLGEVGVGALTKFTDADLSVAGAKYTYKVVAIRKGPSGADKIESKTPVMLSVTAPPTTLPKAPPTEKTMKPSASTGESADKPVAKIPENKSAETGGLSRTIQLTPQNSDEPTQASETTPTTVDTGYDDRLPFSGQGGSGGGSGEISIEELGAGEGTARRRAIMVPIASSLILFVGWMFSRLVRRELAQADAKASNVHGTPTGAPIAQWSMVVKQDDTGPVLTSPVLTSPVLTRSEFQAAKRNKSSDTKQRI